MFLLFHLSAIAAACSIKGSKMSRFFYNHASAESNRTCDVGEKKEVSAVKQKARARVKRTNADNECDGEEEKSARTRLRLSNGLPSARARLRDARKPVSIIALVRASPTSHRYYRCNSSSKWRANSDLNYFANRLIALVLETARLCALVCY